VAEFFEFVHGDVDYNALPFITSALRVMIFTESKYTLRLVDFPKKCQYAVR